MYLNKAIVIGNITQDPELKSLPSGVKVTNFSVATNRKYKDSNDEWQETVEFHNVVVFGKTAENVAQYMSKGSHILVEGRLQTRSWEADGVKKYRTEIIADQIQFGRKGSSDSSSSNSSSSDNSQADDVASNINPDDIPF